jgi:hypothetical protein
MASKIDPHYHTKSSDGEDYISDSILVAQNLGLNALIITDHLSANEHWMAPTHSYSNNIEFMKKYRPVNKEGLLPVIIGIELCIPARMCQERTEILVFGTEMCNAIQHMIEHHSSEIKSYKIDDFMKLKERYECAIVQCHPFKYSKIEQELLHLIDGCEITSCGVGVPDYKALLEECKQYKKTPIASGDGHNCRGLPIISWLGRARTVFSIGIKNEKDLIKAIKENHVETLYFEKDRVMQTETFKNNTNFS